MQTIDKQPNIKIEQKLLNKYKNYNEIFMKEKVDDFIQLNNININKRYLKKIEIKDLKKIAIKIFHKYHKKNVFINNNNLIVVSNAGIEESILKMCIIRKQHELLLEHLQIYAHLGKIIEHAKLVSQVKENKKREKYISWNYYICGVIIRRKKYLIEIEVASLNIGINNYHLHRLLLK